MEWKFVKALEMPSAVEDFLKHYDLALPGTISTFLAQHNGGRPSEKVFATEHRQGYVFKALLSYNQGDKESIWKLYPRLFERTKLYPIGMDSAGNFICIDFRDPDRLVLWNHETNAKERVIDYSFW